MSKKQHDPLCPAKDGEPCKCDLIAKVESRTEDRMFAEWSAADAYRESGLTA